MSESTQDRLEVLQQQVDAALAWAKGRAKECAIVLASGYYEYDREGLKFVSERDALLKMIDILEGRGDE
jgi:hypothetical protein